MITSTEGREELRRLLARDGLDDWSDVVVKRSAAQDALPRALDGLDIAQEMAEVLRAQVEAHEYRFGPEAAGAETAAEMNAVMAKNQDLDDRAWRLTRAALAKWDTWAGN